MSSVAAREQGIGVGTATELPITPPAELPDPDLSENAVTVLERRYLVKDEELRPIETPRSLFW